MLPLRICKHCEELLMVVQDTMRHHAAYMTKAITLARNLNAQQAEEYRHEFTAELVASFNEAQSAWDAYCEHLIEHGLLPHRDRT